MYQVKVFNPTTGTFKMVGPIRNSVKALEATAKQACLEVFRTGLMVKTIEI